MDSSQLEYLTVCAQCINIQFWFFFFFDISRCYQLFQRAFTFLGKKRLKLFLTDLSEYTYESRSTHLFIFLGLKGWNPTKDGGRVLLRKGQHAEGTCGQCASGLARPLLPGPLSHPLPWGEALLRRKPGRLDLPASPWPGTSHSSFFAVRRLI